MLIGIIQVKLMYYAFTKGIINVDPETGLKILY
jgi:hypothetical protein